MDDGSFDLEQARRFAREMVGVLNAGALSLMLSLGHRAGLFDAMAGRPPATSDEVARAAGLNERYVREWLGAMVVAGVVSYDPATRRYHLPAEHAASLTREAGSRNLAALMQFIPVLAAVDEQILRCFREGGGVPYDAFPRFQALLGEGTAQRFDTLLLPRILPLVPGIVDRLEAGIDVADIGCGSGRAVNVMASAFPNSRFTGFDFSAEGIARARAEAERLGLPNATFVVQDVAELRGPGRFDLVTAFDAIHDQARPAAVLAAIHDILREGGWFLCADISASSEVHENRDHPLGPFIYTISTMHCMTVSLAYDGAGLGAAWGEQLARQMMADASLEVLAVHRIEGDAMNCYYVARRADAPGMPGGGTIGTPGA